jgi:hypothetical protein
MGLNTTQPCQLGNTSNICEMQGCYGLSAIGIIMEIHYKKQISLYQKNKLERVEMNMYRPVSERILIYS